jgi:hypothetical protein
MFFLADNEGLEGLDDLGDLAGSSPSPYNPEAFILELAERPFPFPLKCADSESESV